MLLHNCDGTLYICLRAVCRKRTGVCACACVCVCVCALVTYPVTLLPRDSRARDPWQKRHSGERAGRSSSSLNRCARWFHLFHYSTSESVFFCARSVDCMTRVRRSVNAIANAVPCVLVSVGFVHACPNPGANPDAIRICISACGAASAYAYLHAARHPHMHIRMRRAIRICIFACGAPSAYAYPHAARHPHMHIRMRRAIRICITLTLTPTRCRASNTGISCRHRQGMRCAPSPPPHTHTLTQIFALTTTHAHTHAHKHK